MTVAISDRMQHIPFSGIRKIFEEIILREKRGEPVIHLEIGRPDFDTPLNIKREAQRALEEGLVHYTSNYGLLELREAVAHKFLHDNGLKYSPDNEIIITVGANEAVFMAMMALLNPGDQVLVPSPCWTHYYQCARFCGATPIPVPLKRENRFIPRASDFKPYLGPKTKMLVINTPHNPTGAVFERSALEELADFVKANDLLALSDEIYEKLIYNGKEHVSFASLDGMWDRTITINGMSKIYAMTGWRLGYVAAPKAITEAMIKIHQYTTVCAATFAQYGGIEALKNGRQAGQEMTREFDRRRQLVTKRLRAMPGIELVEPNGAFYVLPYIGGLGMDSNAFTKFLLDRAGVAVVPGDAFGGFAENTFRLSYANSFEKLEDAMDRMEQALQKLGVSK